MKKIFVLALVFAVLGGIAFAEEGTGFAAGLEIGFPNIAGEGDTAIGVVPFVEYDGALMDGALDLYGYLGIPLGVTGFGDDMPVRLDFEVEPLYNVSLSDAQTLSFGLNIRIEKWLAPDYFSEEDIGFSLSPKIKFNQNLGDSGNFYGILDVPFGLSGSTNYATIGLNDKGEEAIGIGLNITVGYKASAGFGVEATALLGLVNLGDDTLGAIDLVLSYDADPIEVALTVDVPMYTDGIKSQGIGLDIYGQYTLGNPGLAFYLGCEFGSVGNGKLFSFGGAGLGADKDIAGDLSISPRLGVKYSF